MKKLIAILLVLPMLFGCFAFADGEAAEEAPLLENDLYVLFTSDVHSGVDTGWTYVGLDFVRDNLVAQGNNVILVDNGDSIQGEPLATMTTGSANIELMNTLGYEIATIGNHEFDYGMDRFLELAELAQFPYVSCNFLHNGEPVFAPYIIKEIDNAKVAFVGVSTPKTITSSTPKYFMDENGEFVYSFCQGDNGNELYAAVQAAVDAARAEGVDYVVVLAHCGNETACEPWTYANIIENTNGIDAFLDGHSHDTDKVAMLNKDGEEVLRQGCGTKLEGIGYLKIAVDGSMETGLWKWENDVSAPELLGLTSEMTDAYVDATAELNAKLAEVVAHTTFDLSISDAETGVRLVRNQETNIGDLCADAYKYISGADIAFVNGGGVRVTIPAGDITLNDILKVHPFGNALCVCEVTGQEVLDALELSVSAWPGEFGGWLCPAEGLTYEVHTYLPSSVVFDDAKMFVGVDGEYRVKNVMVNGEPLDLEKTYTLSCHDYKLHNMGDGYTMFADNVFTQESVMLDNQVLITYITEGLGGTITEEYAEPQGRIVFVEEAPAA